MNFLCFLIVCIYGYNPKKTKGMKPVKKNLRNLLTAVSLSAVLCMSGCGNETATETTTSAPETTAVAAAKTESAKENIASVDYSKAVRTVKVPYTDGEEYEAVFAFNVNGDIVKSEYLPWGGGNTYYTYDSEGRLIETRNTECDGTIDYESSPVRERCEYIYDENDNITRINIYEGDREELFGYYTYEYDENGNKTYESYRYGGNGKIDYEYFYEYDSNGNLIDPSVTREYNSNGNLIKESSDDYTNTYEYDADGKLIKSNENGDITTYEYENGLLMSQKRDGKINVEYKYFDNNNIVLRQWYESDGTPNEINIDLYSDLFEN